MIGQVTFNSNFNLMLTNMQRVTAQYQKSLKQASFGRVVNSAADDPDAYTRILEGQGQKQAFTDYQKGIGLADQEMQTADGVLWTAGDRLTRARELAILGSNESYNAEDRLTMADEIAAIREDVRLVANYRFDDRYIFAGYSYDTEPFDAAGAYGGDSGVRSYIAGQNYTLAVNIPGDEVFGAAAGGVDIFAVLETLETALRADDVTGVQGTLDDLDQGLAQLNHARSIYGTRIDQAQQLQNFYDLQSVAVTERVSQEEDIDAAEAYSELAQLSTAMQAALQVSASVSRLSLLDYM